MSVTRVYEIPERGSYDIIVAGGGVAGAAAAYTAAREGKRVLLIEKSVTLGGLATLGLITMFVPMCNGRGKQIIRGLADEFMRLAVKYGFDTIPDDWKEGEPQKPTAQRLKTRYDTGMFALALNKLLCVAGVDLLYDTIVTDTVMEGNFCRGLIVENKSGKSYYKAGMVIDTTGDADVLYRAGVPCVTGKNYFTMIMHKISLESCGEAVAARDIGKAIKWTYGGNATLYGTNHPQDRPLYDGTDAAAISEYIRENQLVAFEKLCGDDRKSRAIVTMPGMAQFRTTRRISGDYTLTVGDVFRHFPDSVGAICDMDHRDYLYEIPYRCLVRSGYPNLITAGRSISAEGYAWDVARVIPPAIITGQVAGLAASISLDSTQNLTIINIKTLQEKLAAQNVLLHFDDSWVPVSPEPYSQDIDHI
jgi:hypothetical protein